MEITRGRVLSQRFFDIAEEVDLPHAEALVSQLSRRPRFVGSARHISLPNPPLEMSLGPRVANVAGLTPNDVLVRIYDVGALVVTFVIDLPCPTDGETLIRLARHISEAEEAITDAAQPVADEIRTAIAKACKPGEPASDLIEDYTIFYLTATTPSCAGTELGRHLDIPRLLLGETDPIAEEERHHLVHASFSYRPEDLVVVDWNSALVLDPTNAQDVPELLELTSMQMLELRAYDSLVGRALDSLYKELEHEQHAVFRGTRYQRLSRKIMQLYVDVIEITERIDNSLTFLGDTWLARIHRSAVAEFGIPHWQKQLRNKLELLRQINELLVNQITSQKSLRIEGAVVVLIVIEILMAAFRVL
jgi:hypothetical protein